jgi:hypothetical protein
MCQLVPDENGDKAIMSFLERKEKVCLWSLPSAFVGLSFSSSRQIAQLSKQRLGDEINASELFKTLVEIDGILNSESAGPGTYFKEPTEEIFHDQLIR